MTHWITNFTYIYRPTDWESTLQPGLLGLHHSESAWFNRKAGPRGLSLNVFTEWKKLLVAKTLCSCGVNSSYRTVLQNTAVLPCGTCKQMSLHFSEDLSAKNRFQDHTLRTSWKCPRSSSVAVCINWMPMCQRYRHQSDSEVLHSMDP